MPNDMYFSWGQRLRETRKGLGLSQSDLARLAGVTRSAIYNVEHARSGPSDDLRIRLAAVLKTTVPELFPHPEPTTYVA